MRNPINDLDCAKDILKTYHQVDDTAFASKRVSIQSRLFKKNKALEHELNALKEKYTALQSVLSDRDERLTRLDRQLNDRTLQMDQLREDFNHIVDQFGKPPKEDNL